MLPLKYLKIKHQEPQKRNTDINLTIEFETLNLMVFEMKLSSISIQQVTAMKLKFKKHYLV